MTTLTQKIPNFLLGISQQPDSLKFPGQVTDSLNTYPDYALGLLKRPGGKFVTELYNATPRGKWFSILRDANEKYVGQYDDTDNTFRIWSIFDGSPRKVDMGTNTGVPGSCNYTNLQTDLVAYNIAQADTRAKLALLHTAQADYSECFAGQNWTIEALFGVNYSYNTSQGTIDQTLTSGIIHQENQNTYTIKDNNQIISVNPGEIIAPVAELIIVNGGTGYSSGTGIATTANANGTGCTVDITATAGVIDSTITINNSGNANYKIGEILTIAGGGGNATFRVSKLTYKIGSERTDEQPNLASTGVRFYEAIKNIAPIKTPTQLTAATTAMNTAQTNYNNSVTAEATAKTNYDAEITNCNISAIPSGGYLNGATADDIELLTLNDYTFVLNKKKTVLMKSTTVPALPKQAYVVIYALQFDAKYQIKLTDNSGTVATVTYTTPSSGSAVDSEIIASNLATAVNNLTGYTGVRIADGIYITHSGTSFTLETVGPGTDSIYGFQDEIQNVSRLPAQCKTGYRVKVKNADDINVDDMWVEFQAKTTSYNGVGVWVETNAPGTEYQFDETTLPHQLVREADGSFKFGVVDWNDRLVGDDITNRKPSFVGQQLRNLFFYRNRFGFLVGETIVLSQAGDFFNFWNNSAQRSQLDDPIDITVSSTRPQFLNFVEASSVGLVIFGQTEQFMLSTDSDILSPTTAKVNRIASIECDGKVNTVSLGTSLGFVSKTTLYSRIFELMDISNAEPPTILDQTEPVPELIPSTIDSMIASAGLSIISVGTTGSSSIYQFRYSQRKDRRQASTWYRWELTGTLLDQFFDISTYYATVGNGSKVYLESLDLTQAAESGFLTLPTGEKTDACIDLWDANPYRTYDSSTGNTRIFLPFDHIADKTFTVLALGNYIGSTGVITGASAGSVEYPTVSGSTGNYYADIPGDFRGRDILIGYIYNMEVQIPKFYYKQTNPQTNSSKADYTADLIMHRMKVYTGLSGPLKYEIGIKGLPTRSQVVNVTQPNSYALNNVNIAAEALHNVPLYQRNENLTIKIVGDSPFPVSLLSMIWEGKYTTNFYTRA